MWHKRITIVLQAVYLPAKLSNESSPHGSTGVKVHSVWSSFPLINWQKQFTTVNCVTCYQANTVKYTACKQWFSVLCPFSSPPSTQLFVPGASHTNSWNIFLCTYEKLLQACAIWWITHNITFLRSDVSCGWLWRSMSSHFRNRNFVWAFTLLREIESHQYFGHQA
jgi:hypothetical protein